MKKLIVALIVCLSCVAFTSCGAEVVNYADGTYVGRSSVYINDDGTDDGNGYGEVTITIADNKITDCVFLCYETNDKLKDSEYGKASGEIANRDFYNKAQKSVASCAEYSRMIVENGTHEGIDAISGATINYNSLLEAMDNALEKAVVK